MPRLPFEVVPYSPQNLIAVLEAGSRATAEELTKKLHVDYFKEYFDHLSAKLIVVESDYVDRDYLEDYAEYYVKCFDNYSRLCTRLHFFSCDLSPQSASEALVSGSGSRNAKKLQASYLGFVVVKPLPKTVVGRTCLAVYGELPARKFPILRTYDVNLYGLALSVKSLAFQEQDTETAACATSALWSVFHGTSGRFSHSLPTPVEITKLATRNQPLTTRVLPNVTGLNGFTMAQAIREVSLEPLTISCANQSIFQSNIYAYLSAGIPLVLVLDLVDVDGNGVAVGGPTDKHAVTIAGYRLDGPISPFPGTNLALEASAITRVYAHDDQVGPFARFEVDGNAVTFPASAVSPARQAWSLSTSWRPTAAGAVAVRAVPDFLLLPLYPKMRIALGPVMQAVFLVDHALRTNLATAGQPYPIERWAVSLQSGNETKEAWRCSGKMSPRARRRALTTPMPRFVWSARAFAASEPVCSIVLDATDIAQGTLFVHATVEDASLTPVLAPAAASALAGLRAAGTQWLQAAELALGGLSAGP